MDVQPYALLGQPCLLNRAIWTILRRLTPFENPRVWWWGFSAWLRVEDQESPQWSGVVEATTSGRVSWELLLYLWDPYDDMASRSLGSGSV